MSSVTVFKSDDDKRKVVISLLLDESFEVEFFENKRNSAIYIPQ